ncbi:YheC/YheD family protein [Paenibacillus sp. N1-5-1-14]|uniref:YheC/YheD family protein n=1 Tax=Paenibacillus radicibacter TaxID=2972488 RepID=UPI002158E4E1|nr:YheC/YheD family protein [Paenibacillus radicibacter]MCR8642092.1 YheC/YheD family protein [Paenibacillus radicibacter]
MSNGTWSKWSKHQVLLRSPYVSNHLPDTCQFSQENFHEMLSKHPQIILKPSAKSGGIGVILVSNLHNGSFRIHRGRNIQFVKGADHVFNMLKPGIQIPYLIQSRINLAEIGKRPYDLRVMVQRHTHSSEWVVTGKLAKIAGPGFIITNTARSRGRVASFSEATRLSKVLNGRAMPVMHASVNELSIKIAKQLSTGYPNQRIMGIDIGIDKNGTIWIIEVNFTPSTGLFLKLKDKSAYQRIMQYKKG